MTEHRVMDWLREGFGVEDAAVLMGVPVDDLRAVVAGYRADGTLGERLTIWPDRGNFIRCRRGHLQDGATMKTWPDGRRQCGVCRRELYRRAVKRQCSSQSIFGDRV